MARRFGRSGAVISGAETSAIADFAITRDPVRYGLGNRRATAEVAWIRELMEEHECIEYARRIAQGLAGAALHKFSLLAAGLPDSRDKKFLEQMATWVIERN